MKHLALKIAGWTTVICAVGHIGFWWIFDWETKLDPLADLEWGVMMALTIATTYALFAFAALTLWRPAYLVTTPLGRLLGWLIVGFWLTRAVDEFIVMADPQLSVVALCVAIALLYVVPLLRTRQRRAAVATAHPSGARAL